MIDETIREDVVGAIEDVLRRDMRSYGLSAVRVSAGEDHDGDPILIVDADYQSGGRPIDPKAVAALVSKLQTRLWAMGERRFAQIRHHFAHDQKIAGYP